MPFFMYGLAPGFDAQPEKFDLAVLLTRITMPYLLCMCLVALMSGALNSVGKFAESSSVSIVLNGAMMAATLISLYLGYNAGPEAGIIQAWGVFVAGLLQLWLLMWGMKRNGLSLKLRRPRWTPDLKKLWQLGVPGIISGGVTQLNIAIGTVIASMQPGAVSHLYYADRIYELPLAIVGIAVGVVLLPAISRSLRSGDHAAVTDSQNRSLELAMMLTIPAAVAIAIMPADIVGVLFERGAFTANDTATTAAVLGVFALGLPAFVLIKVFSPAYFAREDTKTPMRYATISLTANTLGSIALFYVFRAWGWQPELGIAIATSAGGWLNAALLWFTLHKKGDFDIDARFRRNAPLIVLATAVMAGVLYATLPFAGPYMQPGRGFLVAAMTLGCVVAAGLLSFGAVILGTGVLSLSQFKRMARRGG
jgi:putative peptidoglycan lipid II flippase